MKIELENALNEISKMPVATFLEGGPQRDAFNGIFAKPYIDGSDIDRLSISTVALKYGWQWCADTQEFDV